MMRSRTVDLPPGPLPHGEALCGPRPRRGRDSRPRPSASCRPASTSRRPWRTLAAAWPQSLRFGCEAVTQFADATVTHPGSLQLFWFGASRPWGCGRGVDGDPRRPPSRRARRRPPASSGRRAAASSSRTVCASPPRSSSPRSGAAPPAPLPILAGGLASQRLSRDAIAGAASSTWTDPPLGLPGAHLPRRLPLRVEVVRGWDPASPVYTVTRAGPASSTRSTASRRPPGTPASSPSPGALAPLPETGLPLPADPRRPRPRAPGGLPHHARLRRSAGAVTFWGSLRVGDRVRLGMGNDVSLVRTAASLPAGRDRRRRPSSTPASAARRSWVPWRAMSWPPSMAPWAAPPSPVSSPTARSAPASAAASPSTTRPPFWSCCARRRVRPSNPVELDNAILRNLLAHTTRAYEEQMRALGRKGAPRSPSPRSATGCSRTDRQGRVKYLNPVAEPPAGRAPRPPAGPWPKSSSTTSPRAALATLAALLARCIADGTGLRLAERITLAAGRRPPLRRREHLRPHPRRLRGSVGTVIVFQHVSDQRLLALQLAHQATHDELTGLLNRQAFGVHLAAGARGEPAGRLDPRPLLPGPGPVQAGQRDLRAPGRRRAAPPASRPSSRRASARRTWRPVWAATSSGCSSRAAPRGGRAVDRGLPPSLQACPTSGRRRASPSASIGLVPITSPGQERRPPPLRRRPRLLPRQGEGANRIQIYQEDDAEFVRRHDEMNWVVRIHQTLQENRFRLFSRRSGRSRPGAGQGLYFEVLLRMIEDDGTHPPPLRLHPRRRALRPDARDRPLGGPPLRRDACRAAGAVPRRSHLCHQSLGRLPRG